MADIEIRRAHGMGIKAARAAAEKMAEHLGRKFDLKGDWDGNVLHFQRPGVTGTLVVGDKDLSLSVALGMMLRMMKGSIEQAVRHEMDQALASVPKAAPKAASAKPAPPAAKAKAKKAAPRPKKAG